jgi:hypothetical protein
MDNTPKYNICTNVPSSETFRSYMDLCVHYFCVCVVLCVGSGLATGCVRKITELKKRPGPKEGL